MECAHAFDVASPAKIKRIRLGRSRLALPALNSNWIVKRTLAKFKETLIPYATTHPIFERILADNTASEVRGISEKKKLREQIKSMVPSFRRIILAHLRNNNPTSLPANEAADKVIRVLFADVMKRASVHYKPPSYHSYYSVKQ
jgi:hypothetical protein